MNTYIYTGGSSLLTMKDNDIKNFDTISNHYLNIDEVPVKDRRKVRDFVIMRNEDFYNNYKLNKEYEQNRNMKDCNCCEACVKEA